MPFQFTRYSLQELGMKIGSVVPLWLATAIFLTGNAAWGQEKSDKAFLTRAIQGDIAEIEVGQLAETLGATQGVRNYGRLLAMNHGKAKDEALKVARALGVPPPATAHSEAQKKYDKLSKLTAGAFDAEFLRAMVEDHKTTIKKFEVEAKTGGGASAKLANDQLPMLRNHLTKAESLQKQASGL
jgi:putative membrane protein